MIQPAIIIPAFNRVHTLERLFQSIERLKGIEKGTTLIISIDYHLENDDVIALANAYNWQGKKEVIVHEKNKGLREHILWCGDLTEKYGAVIILEDDLLVSPLAYQYAVKALNYYNDDDRIAGISLYSYNYNESVNLPFYPLKGESDVYFMQYTSSWGQAWTHKQWQGFKDWYAENLSWDKTDLRIPYAPRVWPERSWKKYFIKYLIYERKYFVYPYWSLTTNFGDPGANSGMATNEHQAYLNMNDDRFEFERLNEDSIAYDAWFQVNEEFLKKKIPMLNDYHFDVDLYGDKPKSILNKDFVITTKPVINTCQSFGLNLYPPELNVVYEIKGEAIHLSSTKDLLYEDVLSDEKIRYFYKIPDWFWGHLYKMLPSITNQIKNHISYKFKKMWTK